MGFLWITFFNLNGIAPLVFYSGSLFDDESRATSLAIVFTINALAAIVGVYLLLHIGRKPLVIANQIVAICALFSLWYFTEVQKNTTACLIAMICFFIAIALGLGTTLFLYLGEICSDKGMSILNSFHWFW